LATDIDGIIGSLRKGIVIGEKLFEKVGRWFTFGLRGSGTACILGQLGFLCCHHCQTFLPVGN
jgi:hypothetical protein